MGDYMNYRGSDATSFFNDGKTTVKQNNIDSHGI